MILGAMILASALLPRADSMLVTTAWLAAHRADPGTVILHVSMDKAEYDRGHIPGARLLDPHSLIDDKPPGTELPSLARIDSVLETVGVTDASHIVYYGDTWMTPRVFLALEYAGVSDRAALLDGGLPAWRAERRPVSNEVPTWLRGSVTLRAHPEIVVSAEWLQHHLDDPKLFLADGRSPGEYTGSDESERLPRFGHIPGGVNVPWEKTFTDGPDALEGTPSRLKSKAELRQLFEAAGWRSDRDLITYCTIGLRASHLYFIARYLGWHPRIYDGSMREWSRHPELPIVHGPSPR